MSSADVCHCTDGNHGDTIETLLLSPWRQGSRARGMGRVDSGKLEVKKNKSTKITPHWFDFASYTQTRNSLYLDQNFATCHLCSCIGDQV